MKETQEQAERLKKLNEVKKDLDKKNDRDEERPR